MPFPLGRWWCVSRTCCKSRRSRFTGMGYLSDLTHGWTVCRVLHSVEFPPVTVLLTASQPLQLVPSGITLTWATSELTVWLVSSCDLFSFSKFQYKVSPPPPVKGNVGGGGGTKSVIFFIYSLFFSCSLGISLPHSIKGKLKKKKKR